tara:strand:- start:26251 stop:26883 length:633 start_codon:yes stop_codon:yes gene_type:complete
MKSIFYIILYFIGFSAAAQNKYETGMQKALALWQAEKPQEALQLFERIASVETTKWLPSFYASQILVFSGFNEKDKTAFTATMAKALTLLNISKTNSGGMSNAEIIVLEAQYYTAWVAFDGQTYGMQYAGKVADLYQKAAVIAANNPRVVLGRAEWDIGSAKFFGGDVSAYCNEVSRAIGLFETFIPESDLHPSGGQKHAIEVQQQNCGK